MSDLIDSFNRLRTENPEVASALKRAREGTSSGPREDANYYHSAPSLAATSQSAGSDTKQFLEGRDRERDDMGVGNWVFKHRDEIAAGDAERLAKRLEAEQSFANAQTAIEGFKRDSAQGLPCPGTAILSAGDPGGISVRPDLSRPAPSSRYDLPHSSAYSQPVRSLLHESGLGLGHAPGSGGHGHLGAYSPSRSGLVSGSSSRYGTNNSPSRTLANGTKFGFNPNPNPNPSATAAATASSGGEYGSSNSHADGVVLDTKARFGDIDESTNYESKRKLMGRGSIADRVRQSLEPQYLSQSQQNQHSQYSRYSAENQQTSAGASSLNAPLSATVRTAASAILPDSQSVTALMDTIGIRDATIARLEAQIREERRFHESALNEVKVENESLKDTLRRYNADTAKIIEEIRNSAAAEVRVVKEQHGRELDQARLRFDQRVKAVEDDMSKSLSAARSSFENALARIDDLHDTSAVQFRDTLRNERSDALNREKSSLVELLAREQEALLRDGEQRVLAELSRQLQERARTELQRLVQQQTTEVLLPSLKELVTRDVVRAISDRATSAAEQHVEDRSRAMRSELERILEDGEKRLEDAASRLAAGSVVRWSGVVPLIEGGTGNADGVAAFKHHAELMRKLQDDADHLVRDQRESDQKHAQQITALRAQLEQIESELKSEKGVSAALAERLLHLHDK